MRHVFHLIAVIFAVLPGAAMADAVVVFAAASVRGALDEVAQAYDGAVVISYGGSGQIARQVDQGAPADIVLLAHGTWMDWLAERGSIAAANRFDLLGNRLVLIAPAGAAPLTQVTAQDLLGRLKGDRLAMGQTRGVPAGIYGRQWLETTGAWADVAPHLAEVENVRVALALVARGEVPLGVVYATDAAAERDVVTVYDIPGATHDPVIYPVAMVGANFPPQTADFMTFLRSAKAAEVFQAHGFTTPGAQP